MHVKFVFHRTLHRPIKHMPSGKAIPIPMPKIIDQRPPLPVSNAVPLAMSPPPPPSVTQLQQQHSQLKSNQFSIKNDDLPLPPPPLMATTQTTTTTNTSQTLTPMNPNDDESNYAVTEL